MVNRTILVGNLGNDPELRYTAAGVPVANFRVATNESWKDKDGNKQEHTEWHRIVAWAKLAELCGEYLEKGRQVYLEGRLRTRKWKDREGNDRYTTEIIAENVKFLGRRTQNSAQSTDVAEAEVPTVSPEAEQLTAGMSDDIPF